MSPRHRTRAAEVEQEIGTSAQVELGSVATRDARSEEFGCRRAIATFECEPGPAVQCGDRLRWALLPRPELVLQTTERRPDVRADLQMHRFAGAEDFGESLPVAAAAGERLDQQLPTPLAQRLRRHQPLELCDQGRTAALDESCRSRAARRRGGEAHRVGVPRAAPAPTHRGPRTRFRATIASPVVSPVTSFSSTLRANAAASTSMLGASAYPVARVLDRRLHPACDASSAPGTAGPCRAGEARRHARERPRAARRTPVGRSRGERSDEHPLLPSQSDDRAIANDLDRTEHPHLRNS